MTFCPLEEETGRGQAVALGGQEVQNCTSFNETGIEINNEEVLY